MTAREEFWDRIHDRLERGADPLDDDGVREWLDDNPEDLENVARLRARLATLPQVTPSRRSIARRLALPLGILVVVTVVPLAIGAWRHATRTEPREVPAILRTDRSLSIVRFRAEVEAGRGDAVLRSAFEAGG